MSSGKLPPSSGAGVSAAGKPANLTPAQKAAAFMAGARLGARSTVMMSEADDEPDQKPSGGSGPSAKSSKPLPASVVAARDKMNAYATKTGGVQALGEAAAAKQRSRAPALLSPHWHSGGSGGSTLRSGASAVATAPMAAPVVSVPAAPADARVDASTGVRVHARLVSEDALAAQLKGVTVVPLSEVRPERALAGWATFGVLYSKGDVKSSQYGKPYTTWRVFDMDRRLVSVMLVDGAVEPLLSVKTGSLLVFGGAEVVRREPHVPGYQQHAPPDFVRVGYALTVKFPRQVLLVGTASDLSQCTGSMRGREAVSRCSVWLNNKDRRELMCLEHTKNALSHASQARPQLYNPSSAPVNIGSFRAGSGVSVTSASNSSVSTQPPSSASASAARPTEAARAAAATATMKGGRNTAAASGAAALARAAASGVAAEDEFAFALAASIAEDAAAATRRRDAAAAAVDQLFGSDEESEHEESEHEDDHNSPATAAAAADNDNDSNAATLSSRSHAGAAAGGVGGLVTQLPVEQQAEVARARVAAQRAGAADALEQGPSAPSLFSRHAAAAGV